MERKGEGVISRVNGSERTTLKKKKEGKKIGRVNNKRFFFSSILFILVFLTYFHQFLMRAEKEYVWMCIRTWQPKMLFSDSYDFVFMRWKQTNAWLTSKIKNKKFVHVVINFNNIKHSLNFTTTKRKLNTPTYQLQPPHQASHLLLLKVVWQDLSVGSHLRGGNEY
jgi:hypothetical protein